MSLSLIVLLAAFQLACNGDDADSSTGDRLLLLEADTHALEESLETLHEENEAVLREATRLGEENTALTSELAALRQAQAEFVQQQEAAESAREHEEEVADLEKVQKEQLAALEEGQALTALEAGQARTDKRVDVLDERLLELESATSEIESLLLLMGKWPKDKVQENELPEKTAEGTGIDSTLRLAAEGGGQAQVINYGAAYGGGRSSVLVLPDPLPDDEIPLIDSLHGYGSDSFVQSQYVRLHQRVNRNLFALLLPNGIENTEGQRFWNPTDGLGKADQDDVVALAALVEEASEEFDAGPVYIFGYSNGRFMAYHLACKGLPGLRAVASLAGTSYYEDTECEGAPPISVLHIHGMDDRVIRFHGSEESQLPALTPGERYVGAKDMFYSWAERAGCDLNSTEAEEQLLDLNADIEGPETFTYRFTEGCAEDVTIELWSSDEGGHSPGYGDVFVNALLDWLLSQE